MVGTGRGAQLGLLTKGPEVLESTRRVDTIVLDKTGTVTTGKMSLANIALANGVDRAQALSLIGALVHASEHPIAEAIAAAAATRGELPVVESFTNRASASRASSTATPSSSVARHCSPTGRCTCRPISTPPLALYRPVFRAGKICCPTRLRPQSVRWLRRRAVRLLPGRQSPGHARPYLLHLPRVHLPSTEGARQEWEVFHLVFARDEPGCAESPR